MPGGKLLRRQLPLWVFAKPFYKIGLSTLVAAMPLWEIPEGGIPMRIVIRSLVAAVLAAAAAGSFADENNVNGVQGEHASLCIVTCRICHYRFLGSDAQGQLFLPGQSVNLRLGFTRGRDSGRVNDFKIVIQEILITRDPPDATAKERRPHRHCRLRPTVGSWRQAHRSSHLGNVYRSAGRGAGG